MRDSGFKAAVPVFENVFRSNGDFQKLKAILS